MFSRERLNIFIHARETGYISIHAREIVLYVLTRETGYISIHAREIVLYILTRETGYISIHARETCIIYSHERDWIYIYSCERLV